MFYVFTFVKGFQGFTRKNPSNVPFLESGHLVVLLVHLINLYEGILNDDPFWLVTCPSYQSIWWLYWYSYFIMYRLDIVYIVVKATSLIWL